jgi:hypothetical protein
VAQSAVTVGVSPASVTENGATNLAYTFTRSGSTTSALTVNFNVGGTATFSTDYAQSGAATFSNTAGTVTIAAGNSTATVTIDPAADSTVELNETAVLTVAAGTGYTVGSPSNATGTITNDDIANITINDVTLAEGSPSGTTAFTFTVSLSNLVASNVTVDYATANGTATTADSDYTAASGTLTFTAGGGLTQTVTVNVTKDSKVEANETFVVNLGNAKFGGATDATRAAITDNQGVGTITNDDWFPGDANRDGVVDDRDASILASHWLKSGMTWAEGDFNSDGKVNDMDAAIMAAHWGSTLPTEADSPGASLPVEPVPPGGAPLIGPVLLGSSDAPRRRIEPLPAGRASGEARSEAASPRRVAARDAVFAETSDSGPDGETELLRHRLAWSYELAQRRGPKRAAGRRGTDAPRVDVLFAAGMM